MSHHHSRKTEHNILIAFILNLGFSIYELIGGSLTGSVAIVSDAIHDFGDALSIGLSYFLERKSKKQPDHQYTYGYSRYSVMGSMITTSILLLGSGIVIYNAVLRIVHPAPVNYDGMILLAVVGVIVNSGAAFLTHEGNSLNQRSVNLHMLEDVLGWVVVLIGAIIMRFTDISLIDPVLSILVAIYILWGAFQNFLASWQVFLEKAPAQVSLADLECHLREIKGVDNIHHLHVWSLDGYHNYATLHVISSENSSKIKNLVRKELHEHDISHVTIELESPNEDCLERHCNPDPTISVHAHSHHSH